METIRQHYKNGSRSLVHLKMYLFQKKPEIDVSGKKVEMFVAKSNKIVYSKMVE